jgi:glyoxylate reductase
VISVRSISEQLIYSSKALLYHWETEEFANQSAIVGAGYDQIDVTACTEHKIYVSNTPTAVDHATADTAVFLIIGALRNYSLSIQSLRENKWRGSPPLGLGHDPEGKTLGILGLGGIGRNLAAKMRGFNMKIIYHNRKQLSEKDEDGAKYVSFEELLKQSDVLSINVPLNVGLPHTMAL